MRTSYWLKFGQAAFWLVKTGLNELYYSRPVSIDSGSKQRNFLSLVQRENQRFFWTGGKVRGGINKEVVLKAFIENLLYFKAVFLGHLGGDSMMWIGLTLEGEIIEQLNITWLYISVLAGPSLITGRVTRSAWPSSTTSTETASSSTTLPVTIASPWSARMHDVLLIIIKTETVSAGDNQSCLFPPSGTGHCHLLVPINIQRTQHCTLHSWAFSWCRISLTINGKYGGNGNGNSYLDSIYSIRHVVISL